MTQRLLPPVPAHWPSESALIAELVATFPGIKARPVRECGVLSFHHGAWVGGDAFFPDGMSMFSDLVCPDPDIYEGNVHRSFVQWLKQRGWLIEEHDASMYFVTSQAQATDDEAAAATLADLLDQRREAYIVLHRLEAMVAEHRLSMACGDGAAVAQAQQEIALHRGRLAELLRNRCTLNAPSTRDLPF